MSYQMRISARSSKAGRFIASVHRKIQAVFVESGLRQQELAEKLGIDRSIINRRLMGETNLTLRSIADLAWALDRNVEISFPPAGNDITSNEFVPNVETQTEDNNLVSFPKSVFTQSVNDAVEFADA